MDYLGFKVVTYVKDTINRKQFTTSKCIPFSQPGCHLCQRYNKSKAIHNYWDFKFYPFSVVTYVKDTINRKQFTTRSLEISIY